MDEKYLAAALHFTLDRLLDKPRRIRADVSDDRQALFWRGIDGRNVAHAAERHVQRARDRRRSQRQHIDFRAHLLELLFMGHAETLFFIDDQQAEILEIHVGRQQPVGPDHNIHFAV